VRKKLPKHLGYVPETIDGVSNLMVNLSADGGAEIGRRIEARKNDAAVPVGHAKAKASSS
jgi:hypothetical protein